MKYSDKIIELLKKGVSNSEIKKTIYSKYAIILTQKTLNEKKAMVEKMIGKKIVFDLSSHIKMIAPYKILDMFKTYFCDGFFDFNIKEKKLSDAIKLVVRDNKLTEIEVDFIKQKIEELGLSSDLVEKLSSYIFSNNPYLDNMFSLILSDGIIKKEEIMFLMEKTLEGGYDEKVVNQRFWQYTIYHYLKALLKYDSFSKIVKIWYLSRELKLLDVYHRSLIFDELNIFQNNEMEKTMLIALEKLENKVLKKVEETFKTKEFTMPSLYNIIDFKSNVLRISKKQQHSESGGSELWAIKKLYEDRPLSARIQYEKLMKKNNPGISSKKIKEGFEALVS